ncbi:MAG: hypothetical protein RL701_3000 [Pseudomonadota bacterium]
MPTVKHAPGTAALVAAGRGTAVASVCAIGLFQVERSLGGVWSAAAIVLAAVGCGALARVLGRLATLVPSEAGVLAYLSRGFGRRTGVLIAVPYLLLSLFLLGVEALIVGVLCARLAALPSWLGAVGFLLGMWSLSKLGVRVSHRLQALASWSLLCSLSIGAISALVRAGQHGELALRLLPAVPTASAFVAGVGRALFLFMGFELVTSHADSARTPRSVRRTLTIRVWALGIFYALVALGFACIPSAADPVQNALRYAPQLALAEHALGPSGEWLMIAVTILASFASWHGALRALSRFTTAVAAQGLLPRRFAELDARTQLPHAALDALLGIGLLAAALVAWFDALEATILAAAAAAALVYATLFWVRERVPFAELDRTRARKRVGYATGLSAAALAVAVVADAGQARAAMLTLLVAAGGLAWLAARRVAARAPARRRPLQPARSARAIVHRFARRLTRLALA